MSESPIAAVDRAITAVADHIAKAPGMPGGTLARLTERLAELTAQRAELIRQETSQWWAWSGGK